MSGSVKFIHMPVAHTAYQSNRIVVDLECSTCKVEHGRSRPAELLAPQYAMGTDQTDGQEVQYVIYVPVCEACLGDWYHDIPEDERKPLIRLQRGSIYSPALFRMGRESEADDG